jgi:phenylacetate-CoA ligase
MFKDGNGGILRFLNHYNYIDGLNRDQLIESQAVKLRAILNYAFRNTTYYRQVFDEVGFDPNATNPFESFSKIPLLTKEIIRERFSDLKANKLNDAQYTEAHTGGSTGVPMSFLRDHESIFMRKGQELYFDRWMDYRIGDKIGFFVSASHFDGAVDRLKAKIRNATCERMLQFDPHHITDAYMERFAEEFKKYRPQFIKSFPNSLMTFAKFIDKSGIALPAVRSISCTGENLYQQQRALFEKIFGAKVFEKVGTRESGVIACECRQHRGMHVFTEGIFLELLDNDNQPVKPGEIGKVVITDLLNMAIPLVRYVIGDMAIQSEGRACECGCPLPMIEKYLGRDRDVIIDSFGNPKPGYLFTEVIMHKNLSSQFQVVQTDRSNIVVKFVKNEPDVLDLDTIKGEFQQIVGSKMQIAFQQVDKIERDPSGKYGYVISKVDY